MEEQSLRDRLLNEVISASNITEATTAIKSIMTALHINQSYQDMYRISEELKVYSGKIFDIQQKHFNLPTPRKQEELQSLRTEVGFILRETIDKFTQPVTMLKNLVEESKKVVVFEAIKYIDDNPAQFDGVTKSSREVFVGGTDVYKEWVQLRAISYSTYQYLDKIISSTESFLHSLASEIRGLDSVDKVNVK